MNKHPKKRLVMVGVGGMGQAAHLASYLLLSDDCEVVACADLDTAKARLVAQRHGIARAFANHEEMLAEVECDGIVASQQFQIHHQLVPALLRYGKPLFIEKPLASSLAAGQLLRQAIRETRGRVFIGYHKRSDLATQEAKATIQEWKSNGLHGRMTHLRILMPPGDWMLGKWPHRRNVPNQIKLPAPQVDDADPAHSTEQKKQYLEFVNYYIHQVNLIRFLGGQDYAVTHASRNGRLLVAEMTDGTSVCLEMATFSTPLDWQETIEVFFEKAWLRLRLPCPLAQFQAGSLETFATETPGQRRVLTEFPPEHAMLTQARNFLRFLDGEYPDFTTPEEAWQDLCTAARYLELKTKGDSQPCP